MHSQHKHIHTDHQAPKAIGKAIVITVVFMIVELVGGWISNSLALISDGAHMLTDVGAMLLSLFALWVAKRPRTLIMSFGYHRAEILGALGSGLGIWLISGVLVYEAIERLRSPQPVQGVIVFVVASIGLIANLLSMKILHKAKQHNINVRGAYLHLFADALGSVGAIVAGLVLWLTDWRPIDPIITICFSVLMLISSWELVKEAVGILMESTPQGIDPAKVQSDLEALPLVKEVHDLHIWTVSNGRLALSVHLISAEPETVLTTANHLLKTKHGIIHTTIQVERPGHFSSERCYDCKPVGL
ncbi:MAG: cation diffusion facilitator family transporter [Bdellovibrionota bacterium]|mgnify:CR=1 FL=1